MQVNTQLEPLLLSPAEVGTLLGASRSKVFELISEGALPPSYKLGGSRKFKRSDIELWVQLSMPKLDDFIKLARAGTIRLYDREAVNAVAQELKAINSKNSGGGDDEHRS